MLETLVALAIIGIAMAAAMRSTHFSIEVVSELKKRTAASWVAALGVLSRRKVPFIGTIRSPRACGFIANKT